VLDVADPGSFVGAVDEVLASARHALIADPPMAVLVQPQLARDEAGDHRGRVAERCGARESRTGST